MIDPELMKAVIVGVLTAFGGGGAWSWLATRHKPTIDRDTASVANANDVTEKALAIAERADARSAAQEERISALESRLTTWITWGHNIVYNWSVHRQREDPPTLPGNSAL